MGKRLKRTMRLSYGRMKTLCRKPTWLLELSTSLRSLSTFQTTSGDAFQLVDMFVVTTIKKGLWVVFSRDSSGVLSLTKLHKPCTVASVIIKLTLTNQC